MTVRAIEEGYYKLDNTEIKYLNKNDIIPAQIVYELITLNTKIEKFFEKVRGKKVRLKYWFQNCYMIPDTLLLDGSIGGYDEANSRVCFLIGDGLVVDGGAWEYYFGDSAETSSQKPSDRCNHVWKETQGLFKVYVDCERCGQKYEDCE
jgi:hypothetical protein